MYNIKLNKWIIYSNLNVYVVYCNNITLYEQFNYTFKSRCIFIQVHSAEKLNLNDTLWYQLLNYHNTGMFQ